MLPRGSNDRICFAAAVVLLFSTPQLSSGATSDESSNQPYIDQLLKEGSVQSGSESSGDSYIRGIQKQFSNKPSSEGAATGHIEQLRREDPSLVPDVSGEYYTDQERKKLEPKTEGGAIQAVREGKSELKMKMPGGISRSFGLRYGIKSVSQNYSLSSGSGSVDFKTLYGQNSSTDLSGFYEFQPIYSELFGSLGIIGIFGVSVFSGTGQLATTITDPRTGQLFPQSSQTQFQFFAFPASLALNYRFNLFQILRPSIMVGPTALGYWENRSDSKPNILGLSWAVYTSIGISVLLDWMSKEMHWDLYANHKIQHSFFTVDYIQYFPLSGQLKAQNSGVFVGFAFEY